jgi:hypothetical protein
MAISAALLSKYRGLIRGKTRIFLAWIFVMALGIWSTQPLLLSGILVALAGALIRTWASGFLRKDSKLAVGGPYAYCRNPLYLGTYLMAVGFLVCVNQIEVAVVFGILYAGLYHWIILDEETKLESLFGQPYRNYKTLVSRFFPLGKAAQTELSDQVNSTPEAHRFDLEIAKKNRFHEPLVSWILVLGYLWLCQVGIQYFAKV